MLEDSDNPSDDQDEKPTLVSPQQQQQLRRPRAVRKEQDATFAASREGPFGRRRRLQNVEAFGSLLGEEIVSSFSRMLKSEPPPPPPSMAIVTSPPATPKSVDADAMSTGTDTSTGSGGGRGAPDDGAAATPPTPDPVSGASLERLQDCLRHNMERHACEALNTQNVARAVRELLSAHNVGQRLFARFVLGLSQGTVSELLSKPKPWDKLTEKGRDSYRKMHAWASDDFCVFMLKSLVPKKGKESGGSSASSRQEDAAAEERIAQILNEAQQAMALPLSKERSPAPTAAGAQNGSAEDSHADSDQDTDGGGNNNNGSSSNNNQPTSASQKDSKRSSRKYENDDIPQEMVARIYQEELAKLMGQRVEESFRQQQYDRTHEEIRQALSIYHHELSRLSQLALTPGHEFARFGAAALPGALLNGAFPGLSLGPELRGPGAAAAAAAAAAARAAAADSAEAMRAAHEQPQPPVSQHQPQRRGSSLAAQLAPRDWHKQRGGNKYSEHCYGLAGAHAQGSAFSLVRPGVKFPGPGSTPSPPGGAGVLGLSETPPGGAAAEDLGSSPLQRMQSITNSLLTQSAAPSMPPTNQRQNKAVLPPITQQQFDQYNNLNTEEIVKKIFGEAVLGLSQGSVSELLSKPKPWHMLSIKGREPFIRMQLWLNDPHNVEKLQVIKNERREANKRRRTHVDLEAAPRPMEAQPPSLPTMSGPGSFPFAAPPSPFPAAKKPRVLFSDEQKEALRLAFSMDPYPSTATIEFLAAELGLSVRTITNWFHNHRMRLKQHVVSPGPDENQPRSEPPPSLLGPPQSSREGTGSFDPALFRGLLVQRLAEMQGTDKSGPATFGSTNSGASNSALNLNAYNSYSPSSQQGNDEGTLDLSMSSQASSVRKAWGRGGTPTEDLDDSNLSQEEPPAGSDRDSLKEENLVTALATPRSGALGGAALGQHNSYSSRRRKPAAPKWVDPGLSPDSDDAEDDEASGNADDDCGTPGGDAESAIINGVCVRQTATAGDFSLRLRETVRVDPVAASDEARKSAERDDLEDDDEEEETALELCTTAKKSSASSGDGIRKLEQRLDNRSEERGEDWEF
ncbi:hypothetical protein V5799_014057 [Amblyomma americanum]|uniref:DNA-binding protein SATB n=1 Tax=Amblyomma americanum TaxID=6943 RepID=A0AAQ4E455_AMBAM